MSRMFWFTLGAGSGVYAVVKTRRAAERLTPAGMFDQLASIGHGLRLFGEEVRDGMAEHESSLRSRLELAQSDSPQQPAITSAPADATERRVST